MIVSASLAVYLCVLSIAAPRVARHGWAQRAPRLAIAVWLCAATSAAASALIAGFALVFARLHLIADLAQSLRTCGTLLRQLYFTPLTTAAGVVGVTLMVVVTGRIAYSIVWVAARSLRWRRGHAAALTVLSTPWTERDTSVLAARQPMAYCVPGAGRRIVITAGALERLSVPQLQVVLEHERGHLRQRHHALLAWSATLAQAFPFSALMRTAHTEVTRLIELSADDAAIACTGSRLELAEALLAMGGADLAPQRALSATGTAGAVRVRRLIDAPQALTRTARSTAVAITLAIAVAPAAIFAAPAVIATQSSDTADPFPAH